MGKLHHINFPFKIHFIEFPYLTPSRRPILRNLKVKDHGFTLDGELKLKCSLVEATATAISKSHRNKFSRFLEDTLPKSCVS